MSIVAKQFRGLIYDTLSVFSQQANAPYLFSEDAVELLMLTAAQETLMGKYLKQVKGPALGIFQMEPISYEDLFANFIVYKKEIHEALELWTAPNVPFRTRMMGDLPYQIIVARLFYLRKPGKLPSKDNPEAMAHYYKKWWNTHLGAATPEEALKNYNRYGK
jgi:hypothetical protein